MTLRVRGESLVFVLMLVQVTSDLSPVSCVNIVSD